MENQWSIFQSLTNNAAKAASDIVRLGHKGVLAQVPVASFGDFIAVDRQEIEGVHAISNLVAEYLDRKTPKKPISIAVFGRPGSGKSFGVKRVIMETAKRMNRRTGFMEFNLSQFMSYSSLLASFHKIIEAAKHDITPVVLFDEFDSTFEKEALGWLRYFLAPMQDGEFLDNGYKCHLPGAIFVLAGGTAETFEEFREGQHSPSNKLAKVPDFISRLSGYVNVLGPNPPKVELALASELAEGLVTSTRPGGSPDVADGQSRVRLLAQDLSQAQTNALGSGSAEDHLASLVKELATWLGGVWVEHQLFPNCALAKDVLKKSITDALLQTLAPGASPSQPETWTILRLLAMHAGENSPQKTAASNLCRLYQEFGLSNHLQAEDAAARRQEIRREACNLSWILTLAAAGPWDTQRRRSRNDGSPKEPLFYFFMKIIAKDGSREAASLVEREETPEDQRTFPVIPPDDQRGPEYIRNMYMVRRAILFRSMLEIYLKPKNGDFRVNQMLLNELLKKAKLHYGARSLETIIRMSTFRADCDITQADLPSTQQLDLHLGEADSFINAVSRQQEHSETNEEIRPVDGSLCRLYYTEGGLEMAF
ncbi:hypothetical protein BDV40DRAFT_282155 [Aspergillus tamarii]|uniref:ATPase AAA-type core domain-containing protein n=1 Tax=Aspergillus tamarii TaxID=41984 RepID=A0A5N6UBZ8_ASPTM|nr:hypothetical protein BDV40DRAFT_282155 [Aspergillus tamarii]